MPQRKYVIGTGWYCEAGRTFINGNRYSRTVEFHESIWKPLLFRHADPRAVIVVDSRSPIKLPTDSREQIVTLTDNFQLLPTRLNGWMRSFLHGAHFAYCCQADFFYVEQDCLVIGPWIERTYRHAESMNFQKFLVGNVWHRYPLRRGRVMRRRVPWDLQQSLIYVPREIIPELLYRIACTPPIGSEDQMSRCGVPFDFLPFGAGRIRPLPMNDDVLYAQHLSDDELLVIAEREGLQQRLSEDFRRIDSWHG